MTKLNGVTYEATLAVLQELVAERPDYVYNEHGADGQCVYRHGNKPSCIVGHALVRLGFPIKELPNPAGLQSGAVVIAEGAGIRDQDALDLLLRTQINQDSLMPWDEALERARVQVARGLRA